MQISHVLPIVHSLTDLAYERNDQPDLPYELTEFGNSILEVVIHLSQLLSQHDCEHLPMEQPIKKIVDKWGFSLFPASTHPSIQQIFAATCFPLHQAVLEGDVAKVSALQESGHSLASFNLQDKRPQQLALTARCDSLLAYFSREIGPKYLFNDALNASYEETTYYLEFLVREKIAPPDEGYFLDGVLRCSYTLEEKKKIISLAIAAGYNIKKYGELLYDSLNNRDYPLFEYVVSIGMRANFIRAILNKENNYSMLYHLITHLPCMEPVYGLKLVEGLLNQYAVIMPQDLGLAYSFAPKPIWDRLNASKSKLTGEEFGEFLKEIMLDRHHERALCILDRTDCYLSDSSYLKFALSHNFTCLSLSLIERGSSLTHFEDLWGTALDLGNLKLLRALYFANNKDSLELNFLNALIDKTKINQQLRHFYLSNSNEEITLLTKGLQEYGLVDSQIIAEEHDLFYKYGSLVARVGGKESLKNFAERYNENTSSFSDNQVEFGRHFSDIVDQTISIPNVKERPLLDLMQEWRTARAEIAVRKKDRSAEDYQKFRQFNGSNTGIRLDKSSNYIFTLPFLLNNLNKPPSYSEFYNNKLTSITYDPTKAGFYWQHTNVEIVERLLPKLEEFYAQLMQVNPHENPEKFKELLASTYWLGINLMPTARGNAHYFLMFLTFVTRYHGLKPLIPRLETPMVDCIALSESLESFVENFSSYFE